MNKLKDNIIVKYALGLTIITAIVLIVQTITFKSYDAIGGNLAKIILLLEATIIPIVGLYLTTKKICKRNSDIRQRRILTPIFIVSLILSLFAVVYLGNTFHVFGNIEDEMLVFAKGDAGTIATTTLKQYESYVTSYLKINNAKFVIKALMASTLYICILIVALVRHWISKHIEIQKNDIKYIIVVFLIAVTLQTMLCAGFNLKEGNIQIPITIELENKITYSDKQKIEKNIDNMKEIINYEYRSAEDELDNFKDFLNQYGSSSLSNNYNSKYFSERYIINIYYKNKEIILKQLEEIDGIKSIKAGL